MQVIIGNMPQFDPKLKKPKSFQFVVFPSVCVQLLKTFVAKKFQNTQKRAKKLCSMLF